MEPLGDQWSNVLLNGIFSNDDTEFMAQLLDNSPISNESSNVFSSAFWPTDDSVTPTYPNDHGIPMFPLSDNINTNYNFSSSYSQDSYSSGENYYLNESTRQPFSFSFGLMNNSNRSSISSINFCFGENKPKEDLVMQGCGINNNQSQAQVGAGPEAVVPLDAKHLRMMDPQFPLTQISGDNHNCYLMENSKKRPQVYSDHVIAQNQKKRNVKPKKSMNVEVNNNRHSLKTSSCGYSKGGDDDIDNNNSSMNTMSQSQSQSQSQSHSEDVSYGKGKGSRGSASDPQSLYARKRREKINDRLKVLQSLVPNGTKVDISTMLEEAVQYVKFLQLQIKLLSSDEHWMYSPIAYNGMDIGLNMKFPMPSPTTTYT